MSTEIENAEHHVAQDRLSADPVESAGLLSSFVVAVQFLTRLPLGSNTQASAESLRRSPIFFPLIGAAIGVLTAMVIGIGSLVWPVWLAVVVALAVELLVTGALHEDAVADFCDAFGGGWTRDEVLAILKDSRIGSFGALGLFVAFSLRALSTIAIIYDRGIANPLLWALLIVSASVTGRLAMCVAMYFVLPIPQRASLARGIGHGLAGRDRFYSTLPVVPVFVCFAYFQPMQFLASVILVVLGVAWILYRVKRRVGGITGDCLGFICYVAQLLVLLAGAMKFPFWSDVS